MSHLPGYWGASGDTTGGAPAPSGRASGMLLSPHSGQDAPHVRTAGDCANCRRTASLPSTPKSPSASPRQEDNLLHSQDLYEPNHQDPFHKRTLTRSPLLQGQASGLPRLALQPGLAGLLGPGAGAGCRLSELPAPAAVGSRHLLAPALTGTRVLPLSLHGAHLPPGLFPGRRPAGPALLAAHTSPSSTHARGPEGRWHRTPRS